MPDALAVWTMPTNVMSWDAIASNLMRSWSMVSAWLWAFRMP